MGFWGVWTWLTVLLANSLTGYPLIRASAALFFPPLQRASLHCAPSLITLIMRNNNASAPERPLHLPERALLSSVPARLRLAAAALSQLCDRQVQSVWTVNVHTLDILFSYCFIFHIYIEIFLIIRGTRRSFRCCPLPCYHCTNAHVIFAPSNFTALLCVNPLLTHNRVFWRDSCQALLPFPAFFAAPA